MRLNLIKDIVSIYFLFLPSCILHAQEISSPRIRALGGAGLTLQDHWMIFSNPAGIANTKKISCGIAVLNKYILKEYNSQIFAASIPAGKFGVAGFGLSQYGYNLYKQQQFSIGWSRNYSEKFSFGTAIKIDQLHLGEGYGDIQSIKIKAGFAALLSSSISIAALLDNPLRAKISGYNNEQSPALFSIGLSNKFSEKLNLYADAEQMEGNPLRIKSGLEYHPSRQFFLRGGISSSPMTGSFGFGLKRKNMQLDIAVAHHPQLGFSSFISISFVKESNGKE